MAAGGTPLNTPYVFSFMRRGKSAANNTNKQPNEEGGVAPAAPAGAEGTATGTASTTATTTTTTAAATSTTAVNPYETSIKTITEVATVEDFWACYDWMKRPNDLPTTTDYHFFRHGIKPTWEDAGNAKGGKWIVRLPKGLASRYWEEVLLAIIGGQFTGVPDGEICGAVLSVRYSEDILGVWNKTAQDNRDVIERIRDGIKKILQLPPHVANMEYKPHHASMQDRSSFRNTTVWKSKSALEGRERAGSIASAGSGTGGGGGAGGGGAGGGGSSGGPGPTSAAGGPAAGGPGAVSSSSAHGGEPRVTQRSGSWAERDEARKSNKGRDSGRAWR